MLSTDCVGRLFFFFSSRRRHTRFDCDWSSDVCSSDLALFPEIELMKKSLGSMDGALGLEGRGQSIAEWLGTSSGDIRLYVRDGRFSKQQIGRASCRERV